MAQNEAIRPAPTTPEIPDKLYFRIGDVAKLCEVPAYVLRFWEAEFPQLKPNKGGTGQRLYRRKDVEMALRVKRLLYDDGYTIPGARQILKQDLRSPGEPQLALGMEPVAGPSVRDLRRLQGLRKDLEEVHAMLSRPPGTGRTSVVQSIRAARGPRAAQTLSLASKSLNRSMDDLFDPKPALVVAERRPDEE